MPVKKLPIISNWNLIWLSSKNMSVIAKEFKNHIETSKDRVMDLHFNWFDKY
ncbi:MAG: hypothetical protein ACJA1Z_001361 [Patiriisocius sp.]